MAITLTNDSASISTTEYFLASDSTSATYQTADCILQAWIGLSAMIAGDQYRIRVYEKVNGATSAVVYEAYVTGVQPGPFVTPSLVVGEGWEVSVTRTAGSDRTINWSLRTVA